MSALGQKATRSRSTDVRFVGASRVARGGEAASLKRRPAQPSPVLAAAFSAAFIPESREDLNPIAVSLLRKRLLRLECACVEPCCDGGISGAVSNKQ
jgi:hypothetical protein